MCLSPTLIKEELIRPRDTVRWLGYWFTPAMDSSAHFSHCLALAHGAFALLRPLSPPGAGLAPYFSLDWTLPWLPPSCYTGPTDSRAAWALRPA